MATKAGTHIRQLKNIARNSSNGSSIEALLELSEYYNKERSKLVVPYAKRALEQAIKTDNHLFIAKAHIQFAHYFLRFRTDYLASLNHCEKALNFSASLTSKKELAEVFKMLGINYHYLGDLEKSQDNYRNALDILLSLKVRTNEEEKLIGDLYYNLAILNRSAETLKFRKPNLELAQKHYEQAGAVNGVARCHDGMAVYYFYKGQHKKSLECSLTALGIFEKIKDEEGIYLTCNNIGTLKIETGKFKEGLEYLTKSLNLRKQTHNSVAVATSYINIGNAYAEKKKNQEALDNFIEAEKILRKAKSKFELSVLLQSMSNCYWHLAQHEKAYKYLDEHSKVRNELHQYELEKAYRDTTTRYDIELSEKNATIDRLRNFEIADYVHKLEVTNAELRQFAHVASHDLKEPLRTITSFVGLLEKHCENKIDDTGREYLNYIISGTQRLESLMKDILNLSRINQKDSQFTEVNLNLVYKDVAIALAAIIGEKNVHLNCGKLPVVIADRTLMFQLFMNLVVNAIKYNNHKYPTVNIKSQKAGSYYKISFADNGIGISEEYRDKIFEIFQRLHPREYQSGTGIGLTLCKRIVEKHKGKIWVEENKPSGSVFNVTLPA